MYPLIRNLSDGLYFLDKPACSFSQELVLSRVNSDSDVSPSFRGLQLRICLSDVDGSMSQNMSLLDMDGQKEDLDRLLKEIGQSDEIESFLKKELKREDSLSAVTASQVASDRPDAYGSEQCTLPTFRRLQSYVGKPEGFDLFSNEIDDISCMQIDLDRVVPTPSQVGRLPDPSTNGLVRPNFPIETSFSSPSSSSGSDVEMSEQALKQMIDEIPYQDGVELPLGEAGREMLRSIIRERIDFVEDLKKAKCRGRVLQNSRNASLLKMAFECGAWEDAVKIHLEHKGVLPMSFRHRDIKDMKKTQSMKRRTAKGSKTRPSYPSSYLMHTSSPAFTPVSSPLSSSSTSSSARGSVSVGVPYFTGITLKLGGAGRELLKKKLRDCLKKKHADVLKRRLESEGIYYGSLRKSTLADLFRMAYVCGLWDDAVRIHLEFLGQLPLSLEHQRKKIEMQERDKLKRCQLDQQHFDDSSAPEEEEFEMTYLQPDGKRKLTKPRTTTKRAKKSSALRQSMLIDNTERQTHTRQTRQSNTNINTNNKTNNKTNKNNKNTKKKNRKKQNTKRHPWSDTSSSSSSSDSDFSDF